jgi:hypothetical protein
MINRIQRNYPQCLGLGVLLFASCAWALDDHWYGGRSDGQWQWAQNGATGNSPLSRLGLVRPSAISESQSSVRFYGGYRFNKLFSLEGAHTSMELAPNGCLGNDPLTAQSDGCLGSALSMSAVSQLPIAGGWNMYGRLGIHTWQPGAPTLRWSAIATESSDYGRVFGLGLGYTLSERITFRFESERYTGLFAPGALPNASADALVQSVSLTMHF